MAELDLHEAWVAGAEPFARVGGEGLQVLPGSAQSSCALGRYAPSTRLETTVNMQTLASTTSAWKTSW